MSRIDTFCGPSRAMHGRARAGGKVYGIDRWLLHTFLHGLGEPTIRAKLWDGKDIVRPGAATSAGMTIHDRATLWRLFTNPLLNFGDDYSAGRIDIDGGLVAFMEAIYRAMEEKRRHNHPAPYRRKHPDTNSPADDLTLPLT